MSLPAPPFVGVAEPSYEISRESPKARNVLYLVAQGRTNKEISEIVGMHPNWVSQLTRQPWFLENLAAIMHEAGMSAIRTKLQTYAVIAADKAFEMMHDSQSETVKAQCAFQLMKVGVGEIHNVNAQQQDVDPAKLEAEIERRKAEIEKLTNPPKENVN